MWQRVQVVTWHALEQGGDSENEAEVGVGSGWLRGEIHTEWWWRSGMAVEAARGSGRLVAVEAPPTAVLPRERRRALLLVRVRQLQDDASQKVHKLHDGRLHGDRCRTPAHERGRWSARGVQCRCEFYSHS